MGNRHKHHYPTTEEWRNYYSKRAWQILLTNSDYALMRDFLALGFTYERRRFIAQKQNTDAHNAKTEYEVQQRTATGNPHWTIDTSHPLHRAWDKAVWRLNALGYVYHIFDSLLFRRRQQLLTNADMRYLIRDEVLPRVEQHLAKFPLLPHEYAHPARTHKGVRMAKKKGERETTYLTPESAACYYTTHRKMLLRVKEDIEELLARWSYPAWVDEAPKRCYEPHTGRLVEPPHPKKPRTVKKILKRPRLPGEGAFMGGHLDT